LDALLPEVKGQTSPLLGHVCNQVGNPWVALTALRTPLAQAARSALADLGHTPLAPPQGPRPARTVLIQPLLPPGDSDQLQGKLAKA